MSVLRLGCRLRELDTKTKQKSQGLFIIALSMIVRIKFPDLINDFIEGIDLTLLESKIKLIIV